jgi:predicted RecA/RadA family phage recombinase
MAAGEAVVRAGATAVDHTPATAVAAGEVVDIGVFSVAQVGIPAGSLGSVFVGPMTVDVTKPTGGGTDYAVGTDLFWDASGGEVTVTSGSNLYIGTAIKVPATTDTFVSVHATGQARLG